MLNAKPRFGIPVASLRASNDGTDEITPVRRKLGIKVRGQIRHKEILSTLAESADVAAQVNTARQRIDYDAVCRAVTVQL